MVGCSLSAEDNIKSGKDNSICDTEITRVILNIVYGVNIMIF